MATSEPVFLDLTEKERRKYCPVPPPRLGWRWWTLWVPPAVSSAGLFLFNIPGLAFVQLSTLPPQFLTWCIVAGAICLTFGSEVGTMFNVWEVLRKKISKVEVDWLDIAGILFSALASTFAAFLSWTWGLYGLTTAGFLDFEIWWLETVTVSGPLVVTIAVIADFLFGCLEGGKYLGLYDKAFQEWQTEHFIPWMKEKERGTGTRAYEEPTGDYAYTPELPAESTTMHCWCGTECETKEAYQAHLCSHAREFLYAPDGSLYADAVTASRAVRERAVSDDYCWPFPKLEEVVRLRRTIGAS